MNYWWYIVFIFEICVVLYIFSRYYLLSEFGCLYEIVLVVLFFICFNDFFCFIISLEFYDVIFLLEEGIEFRCYKCIFVVWFGMYENFIICNIFLFFYFC